MSKRPVPPNLEAEAKLAAYNRSLQKAGILLAADRLFPPSTAARISYANARPTVTEAPFADPHPPIAHYWILQVRTREEAIEWARRAPLSNHDTLEVRQIRDAPAR